MTGIGCRDPLVTSVNCTPNKFAAHTHAHIRHDPARNNPPSHKLKYSS